MYLLFIFYIVVFYVMDEDVFSWDDVIGKVCFLRDILVFYFKGFSGWIYLMEVDFDEEV